MKKHFTLKTVAAALCVAALLPQIASSQNVNVTFDSASDLTLFNHVNATDGASTSLAFSSGTGISGSGSLSYDVSPVDTTAIYTGASYDLSGGQTVTVSIDFLTGGTVPFSGAANAVIMLGLTGSTGTGFYSVNNAVTGDNFVGGRLRRVSSGNKTGLQSQTKLLNSGATSSPSDASVVDITFTANEWYRLALDITRTATANTFAYTMTLYDIGADGTATPASVANGSITGTMVNADLYNDSSVFAAFRGVPTVGNAPTIFDNFTVIVTPVPEPASVSLAALGGITLLLLARGTVRRVS